MCYISIMERDFKTLGIVINAENVRENDRLLTVLTPDRGLVYALSFGSRKSQRAVKAPLYTEGNFSLYEKGEQGQVHLKDVDVISIHEGLSDDLDALVWASLFSELVIKGRYVDGAVYRLFTECLDALEEEDKDRTAIYFLVHYLSLSGLCGDYRICPSCGKSFGETEILGFSTLTATAVCKECDNLNGSLILPPNARRYLARVLELPFANTLELNISEEMGRRISRNLLRSLRYTIPAPLKTLESGLI